MFSKLKEKQSEERYLASHIIRMMKNMGINIDMNKLNSIQYLHEFMAKHSKYKHMSLDDILEE